MELLSSAQDKDTIGRPALTLENYTLRAALRDHFRATSRTPKTQSSSPRKPNAAHDPPIAFRSTHPETNQSSDL